jgi:RNA polymerase sigma-70 factor (family 1)
LTIFRIIWFIFTIKNSLLELLNTDKELVNDLQSGDTEAFDLIYKKYSGKLYSFGLKYLASTSEAEELVQSVFLKVWENRKTLNKELSFNSYLFTIAYHDICKHFRKKSYQKQFMDETLRENVQSSNNTEEGLDFKSVLIRVEQILNTLPVKQKLIFKKSRLDGLSTKEIAKELNLSPGTVDNYVSETLKYLKGKIGNEDLMVVLFFSLFVF